MVMATSREAPRPAQMVSAKGCAIFPAKPPASAKGTKTATVVSVEAVMASPTSTAPSTAATLRCLPPSKWR